MPDLDEIISRIHSGKKLRSEELAEITDLLRSVDFQEVGRRLSADDIYLLLTALSREKFDRKIFERFFDFEDPTTASLIARVLCSTPEGRSEYLEKLIGLALGSSWDPEGDVQQEALELLGEFVREERAAGNASSRLKRVLKLLFEIFEAGQSGRELKLWSYTALLRAAGVSEEQLPSRYASIEFRPNDPRVDWKTLEKLQSSLSS